MPTLRRAKLLVRLLPGLFPALALVACGGAPDDSEQVNPSVAEGLSSNACGTALASFDGTTAYSNGGDTATGYSCAGSGAYGLQYQCVELVQRHFKTHWGLHWYGNAKDLLNNAPRAAVDVYRNGDAAHPPVPGDMLVWETGTWGHVALVKAVHDGSLDIIEQNVHGSGSATLTFTNGHVGVRWGSWNVAGWAHAKANTAGSSAGSASDAGAPDDAGASATDSGAASDAGASATDSGAATDAGSSATDSGAATDAGSSSNTPVAAPGWSCNNSAYGGGQYWTCTSGNLFKCIGGSPMETRCQKGCNVRPLGVDDTCK